MYADISEKEKVKVKEAFISYTGIFVTVAKDTKQESWSLNDTLGSGRHAQGLHFVRY